MLIRMNMNAIIRFYYVILVLLIGAFFLVTRAHAVEINPEIKLKNDQANHKQGEALNEKVLPDTPVNKVIPDVNSVGLNFKFKVD